MAASETLDISGFRLVDAADALAAAAQAVALARAGAVQMLIKGGLHTDEFMHPVMSSQGGLR